MQIQHSKGKLVISLDFELYWGTFDKRDLADLKQYYLNTRKAIDGILDLFLEFDIHATWAIVGLLFNKDRKSLIENLPQYQPTYKNMHLSPYPYILKGKIGENETTDPFHYAPSIIQNIKSTPGQEIGTHTFSHYLCNEPGQTAQQFKEDLNAAKKIAKDIDIELKSLVFPRNQFNTTAINTCGEVGIRSVRTNPRDWWWKINSTQAESKVKRLFRGVDAYFKIGKKTSYKLLTINPSVIPIQIPASRLLRPYSPGEGILNKMRLSRIKREMSMAAVDAEVYHLWWHPHNFGKHPEENLMGLRSILDHYAFLREKYGFQSKNMDELTAIILNKVETTNH